MPEVLGDAGVYFDPESPIEIESALQTLAGDDALRARLAQQAWLKAQQYSWQRCADETFEFIAQVAQRKAGAN
jgi:glycosyltransferase involved in cell wall biosynthesis